MSDLVLIGGLWLDEHAWDAVVPLLAERGHRGVPVALPADPDTPLEEQVTAVLAVVDASIAAGERPIVVGHSAACTLAWLVADARPEAIARVGLIGGFPSADGEEYAAFFPLDDDGVMPFPGWEPFEGPDADDLTAPMRADIAARAVPTPGAVSRGVVHLQDPRRHAVPVTLICPEFSPAEARAWVDAGDVPELAAVRDLAYVDLATGHWPMFSDPAALAEVLVDLAE